MHTMNVEEACRILHLTGTEDTGAMKKQYRRLMGRFHPDASGSDRPEHLKKAQLINEAYAFLKEHPLPQKCQNKWQAAENARAFCERNIYQYVSLDDEKAQHMYYQVARGKYFWQPLHEEFTLFIMSVHHAVKELTDTIEVSIKESEKQATLMKSRQFQIKAELFYLLSQQFIQPLQVMEQMSKPVSYDQEDRSIWHFRAWIGTKSRNAAFRQINRLQSGANLYPKSFDENKILVRNEEGAVLGHLSFEEDWVYLCVIPLLKQKKAQVRMRVAQVEVRKGTRPYAVKADIDFYLRLQKDADAGCVSGDLNLEIARLLMQYEQC